MHKRFVVGFVVVLLVGYAYSGPRVGRRPPTTVAQTLVPRLPIKRALPHVVNGQSEDLGKTDLGAGEPYMVRDDLQAAQGALGPCVRSSLTYLAQLSDMHIFDEESPARWYQVRWAAGNLYRYQEAYTAQVLDAMVRTINRFHTHHVARPLDFAVVTGDVIDNAQRNELDWFVQVMDGKWVHPDSGADDDPIAGVGKRRYGNDPSDGFQAAGLVVPWYVTAGNHDTLYEGIFANDNVVGSPTRDRAHFAVDYTDLDQSAAAALGVHYFVPRPCEYYTARARSIVSDRRRRMVRGLDEFMKAHLDSPSEPVGHGFTKKNVKAKSGYYVAKPVAGVPLRLIGLDTTPDRGSEGKLSKEQLERLERDLQRAERAGALVVVISHHPSANLVSPWSTRLRKVLWSSPNVVLHLAGHTHRHGVVARRPVGAEPGVGYWEVITASLIDWPQQQRLVEIVDRGDGTGEIFATVVDYQIGSDSLIEDSRFYAIYGKQVPTSAVTPGADSQLRDRNVTLRFAMPVGVQANLATLPRKPVESLTFEQGRR